MSRRSIALQVLTILSVLWCAVSPAVMAQPDTKWIRVAVVQDRPTINLQVHGRFTMSALHTGEPIQQERRLPLLEIHGVPEGLAIGGTVIPFFGVRIEPAGDATINLNGQRLRGTIEIVRQKNLTLLVINHLALEDYLRGVLSKEAPDYWPPEALKAIAIAARTYAVYQRYTKEEGSFDVSGDVMSQDYGGKTSEKIGTTRAVKATAGWILLYKGKPFPTFYHSTCGGMTEPARVMGSFDLEPLRGQIVCNFCSGSPFYRWQRRLTKADVAWALRKSSHGSVGTVYDVRVAKRTAAGRVEQIAILGGQRTVRLTGYEFRALFGFDSIRSPAFAVTPIDEGFLIAGRGWGHGVGMCQWGVAELARRGLSATEILAFYYPGAELAPMRALAEHPIDAGKGGS